VATDGAATGAGGERDSQLGDHLEHPLELAGLPGQGRELALDILKGQRHPALVVVGPQQPGAGRAGRQGGGDLGLGPEQRRGVRVGVEASGLDEHPSPIGQPQPRRQPW
jgi:hypothetical protein